jgi:SAM-dependent methyltransferase
LSDVEWLEMIIAQAEGQALELPAFPTLALQAQFVGSTNSHAMREAFNFYVLIKDLVAERGMVLGTHSKVLDFGCGWGRYIRLLMKDVGPCGLHGADVDPDMIGFCRVSGLPAQFSVLPPLGPAPYEDSSFELIFAYSVFSHLSESAFADWMCEFGRILCPGGLLIFTTQPRRFLEWTVELRQREPDHLSGWERSLCSAFPDVDEAIAAYDTGRYVFAATGGGEHRPASFYGETAISQTYLAQAELRGLQLDTFIDDPTVCPQAVAVLRKRSNSAAEEPPR